MFLCFAFVPIHGFLVFLPLGLVSVVLHLCCPSKVFRDNPSQTQGQLWWKTSNQYSHISGSFFIFLNVVFLLFRFHESSTITLYFFFFIKKTPTNLFWGELTLRSRIRDWRTDKDALNNDDTKEKKNKCEELLPAVNGSEVEQRGFYPKSGNLITKQSQKD